jgi:hypothetical protein
MRLGDPLARGLLPARIHWRFCAMGKSVCRGARSVIVLCEPPRTAYGFTPACCLIDREAPMWRRNAETLTKMAALSAGSNGVTLSHKERLPNWNGREKRLASNTSPLVEGDKGFRDFFEEGSFARKAGQMVPLIELARVFAIRDWHPGGYPITQTGYLLNIYFIRKDEGARAVRKLHQIHMAIKIEDLAHNDRHLLKPAAARTISNRPA